MQIGSLTLRVIAWRSGRWHWTPRLIHRFGQTRMSGVWHVGPARVLLIYPNAAPRGPHPQEQPSIEESVSQFTGRVEYSGALP